MSSAVLEQVRRLAPLGLELLDAASGRRVGDGLVVRVAPVGRPQRVVIADANPSGIFVAHDLPGLGNWSHGGDEPLPHPEYDIGIDDRLGRFLPCRLRLALPAAGLAHPACRADIPLFSAPTRVVPGLAAIRAEIVNHATGKPAAWSVVEVRHAGRPAASGRSIAVLPARAHPLPRGAAGHAFQAGRSHHRHPPLRPRPRSGMDAIGRLRHPLLLRRQHCRVNRCNSASLHWHPTTPAHTSTVLHSVKKGGARSATRFFQNPRASTMSVNSSHSGNTSIALANA